MDAISQKCNSMRVIYWSIVGHVYIASVFTQLCERKQMRHNTPNWLWLISAITSMLDVRLWYPPVQYYTKLSKCLRELILLKLMLQDKMGNFMVNKI